MKLFKSPLFRFAGDALFTFQIFPAFYLAVAIFLFVKDAGRPWWALGIAALAEALIWIIAIVGYRLHVRGKF